MSSGKVTRVADKVTYLRPVGKAALKLFINDYYRETGKTLREWEAWEMIIQKFIPELMTRAIELEERTGTVEGNGENGNGKQKE